jgi:hypothetical protein
MNPINKHATVFPHQQNCSLATHFPSCSRMTVYPTAYPSVTTCALPTMPMELRPCWVLRQRSSNSPGWAAELIQIRILQSMHPIEPEPESK